MTRTHLEKPKKCGVEHLSGRISNCNDKSKIRSRGRFALLICTKAAKSNIPLPKGWVAWDTCWTSDGVAILLSGFTSDTVDSADRIGRAKPPSCFRVGRVSSSSSPVESP